MRKVATKTTFNENPLLSIPSELLVIICNKLELTSIITLGSVCHFFQQFTSDPVYWQNHIEICFSYLKDREIVKFNDNPRALFIEELKSYLRERRETVTTDSILRVLRGEFSFINELRDKDQKVELYSLALSTGKADLPGLLKDEFLSDFIIDPLSQFLELFFPLASLPNPYYFRQQLRNLPRETFKEKCIRDAIVICAKRGNFTVLRKLFGNREYGELLKESDLHEIIFHTAKYNNIVFPEAIAKNILNRNNKPRAYDKWLEGALAGGHFNTFKYIILNYLDQIDQIHLSKYLFEANQKKYIDIEQFLITISNDAGWISSNLEEAVQNNLYGMTKLFLTIKPEYISIKSKNLTFIRAAFNSQLDLVNLLLSSFDEDISFLSRIKALTGSAIFGKKSVFLALAMHSYKRYSSQIQFLVTSVATFCIASLLLGSALGLLAKLSISLFIPATIESVRRFRNFFKSRQYKDFQSKTSEDFDRLSFTQLEAFDIGVKSAQGVYQQILSFGSWKACCASKEYYAGYEAKICDDNEMINNLKGRLNVNLKPNANNNKKEDKRPNINPNYLGLKRGFLL